MRVGRGHRLVDRGRRPRPATPGCRSARRTACLGTRTDPPSSCREVGGVESVVAAGHTNCAARARLDIRQVPSYTVSVPASRSDARLLLDGHRGRRHRRRDRGRRAALRDGRSRRPTKYEPFSAGPATAIKQQLREGGPYFVPDPFGGNRASCSRSRTARSSRSPTSCPARRTARSAGAARVNRFSDCNGDRVTSEQLDRYRRPSTTPARARACCSSTSGRSSRTAAHELRRPVTTVHLAHEERGAGDPPMLFLHGMACVARTWTCSSTIRRRSPLCRVRHARTRRERRARRRVRHH